MEKKINIIKKYQNFKKIKSIKKVIVFPYRNNFEKKINKKYLDFNLIIKKSKIDSALKIRF